MGDEIIIVRSNKWHPYQALPLFREEVRVIITWYLRRHQKGEVPSVVEKFLFLVYVYVGYQFTFKLDLVLHSARVGVRLNSFSTHTMDNEDQIR